ncbi:hypothetical protein VT84_17665 [Gemmata sp. SH-PL17]|nr:hypothetical protein VT84_17665 [Gemmata sp. SH-PL17]
MATRSRIHRATQWIVGAGALALPACATPYIEQPAELPHTLQTSVRPIPSRPPTQAVVQTSAQIPADGGEKSAPPAKGVTLPAVPAAATQGKPLPIDLPTALTLTSAARSTCKSPANGSGPRPPHSIGRK